MNVCNKERKCVIRNVSGQKETCICVIKKWDCVIRNSDCVIRNLDRVIGNSECVIKTLYVCN